MRVPAVLPLLAAALLSSACSDPFAILPASITNTVDTVEVYAVNGTSIERPSGYVIANRLPVRLGLDITTYNFDFLYRIDTTGAGQFVPFAAIAPTSIASPSTQGRSGFLATTSLFEQITQAELVGYVTDQPIDLTVGKVFYARSALPNGCFLGIPYYAKIEILSFDELARSVKFRILVDVNCGYRGLEPGLPSK